MVQFISIHPEGCTGCRECEMVCSLYHFGECNPERSAVRVIRNEGQGLAEPLPVVCQQCDQPACMNACAAGAIYRDHESGLVKIDPDACTGCFDCMGSCPAECIFRDPVRGKAIICDLCRGAPQCVALCHSGSLKVGAADRGEGGLVRISRLVELKLKAANEAAGISQGK